MFLKQLEIIGFKSFANKITIDFSQGVTAVVGPNGSGKSNITDAIRWVLGEQSVKSLRGSKMEDIIFSGSEEKRPLNMAEVTLVLDNNDHYLSYDYSEISVTRRVFRSGESEFLLNGQKCRLKDIVDLFMDSGLGREAYSIIGQGRIDDILNSKAEEKRKIFEEAAGVLKYKLRKQSAERKLEESQENLNRVEDIIYELDSQIEPLEEQASVAKDYLDKKERLEAIEVALLAHDIGATHEKWEQRAQSVESLKQKALDESSAISKQEAEAERLRTYIQALDESIDELQEALLLASELQEKYEGEKKVLEERRKHARENAERFKRQIEDLEARKQREEEALIKEKKALEAQKAQLAQLEAALREKTEALDHFERDLEQRLEKLKNDYFEQLNQAAAMRNEKRYLEEQLAQIEKKASQLENEQAGIREQASSVATEKKTVETELRAKSSEWQAIKEELTRLLAELDQKRADWERRRTALQKADQLIDQAEARRGMLIEMEEAYAGFFGGVKAVLKAKGKPLKGIKGAVAELIKANRAYEVAIETALGSAMQHIVVDREEHAREAIQFLKAKKAGRATFLPLSVIKPRWIPDRELQAVQDHSAFVGTGAALVEYDHAYHAVIGHLLGSIVVAKDLKGANELARLLGYKYRIVTLDGDVVSPGGAMSGGSRKTTGVNLLGRGREIESLTKQLAEMKEKRTVLAQEIQTLKEALQADDKRRQTLEKQEALLADEVRTLEAKAKEMGFVEKSVNERIALYNRDQERFEQEKAELTARLDALTKALAESAKQEEAVNRDIEKLSHQKQHQEEAKVELQNEITELKVAYARQKEVVATQSERTVQRSEQLKMIAKELDQAKTAVASLDSSLQDQIRNQEILVQSIEEGRKDKERLNAWIAERRKMRLELSETLRIGEEELKELKRIYKGTEEALRRDEIALERLDVELDNLLDRLREEYHIGYEMAKERHPLTMEPDEARKQVKLLKRAIDELGHVNLGAIEEFERVSTRLRFLKDQREDLLQAKQTLLNVINEMDEEVRKRFGDVFERVREQFQIVFKQLFGGGHADLQLTDPNDLLYSGVDILAQPPGKKLQQLSLLSGGERALTAIALLFAILKVRPVPFCVLDEVEAALDDANVDRYADFLRNFSRETQFIVVTHRKGTMEQADVLYGVTMQESGVSKLVSVRLEDTEKLVG
jgi:chromosome segregation protein